MIFNKLSILVIACAFHECKTAFVTVFVHVERAPYLPPAAFKLKYFYVVRKYKNITIKMYSALSVVVLRDFIIVLQIINFS